MPRAEEMGMFSVKMILKNKFSRPRWASALSAVEGLLVPFQLFRVVRISPMDCRYRA